VYRRLVTVALTAALLTLIVGACGEEEDPTEAAGGGGFELTSPAFGEGDAIPDEFAVDGGNTSPPLAWTGVPSGAEELAITVVDPDASDFVHWIMWGIDPVDSEIEAGAVPPGATVGMNQFGQTGWDGPQPPAGEEHTYVFTVHALSRPPALETTTSAVDALSAIEELSTEQAELRGQYETG
jgi:Raf kinase inhibitor-like YbhB/YbcL family protein